MKKESKINVAVKLGRRYIEFEDHTYYALQKTYDNYWAVIKKDKENNIKMLFYNYDKNVVKKFLDDLIENEALPNIPSDVCIDKLEQRVLVYKSKHYTYYYKANTGEELKKVCIKILSEEFNSYYKPLEPINDSGINSLEELETLDKFKNLPESVLNTIKYNFKSYIHKYREYKQDINSFNDLKLAIEGKLNTDQTYNILQEFESDRIELETLITA